MFSAEHLHALLTLTNPAALTSLAESVLRVVKTLDPVAAREAYTECTSLLCRKRQIGILSRESPSMKRILCSLALLIAVGKRCHPVACSGNHVEAELELVKQLRARGWNDLAKAKIEALLKRNDPTLNAVLPLELARINISSARLQDPDQRLATFNTARGPASLGLHRQEQGQGRRRHRRRRGRPAHVVSRPGHPV